jgi:two-component system sensor histidine kinase UhpB
MIFIKNGPALEFHASARPHREFFPIFTQHERSSLIRDLSVMVVLTVAMAAVAAYFELSEKFFISSRKWEHLEIDELPAVFVALSGSLAWFAWRRVREARAEIARRREAEAQLATLLSDNRRLAQQNLRMQESERKALARELHDELGQYLNAIKTDAVTIQERSSGSDGPWQRASSAIVGHVDHVHSVVSDLIRRLRPVGLDDLGLRAALEHFLSNAQQRLPQVRIVAKLEGDLDSFGEATNVTIYRLAQEGMTNVAKHSGATRVELRLVRIDGHVEFAMLDDGRGADPNAATTGLGLIGMRERVEMLGGQMRIETARARGFEVHARIPVSEPETSAMASES